METLVTIQLAIVCASKQLEGLTSCAAQYDRCSFISPAHLTFKAKHSVKLTPEASLLVVICVPSYFLVGFNFIHMLLLPHP